MSEVTYYVALPFVAADDGIAAAEAVECFNPNAAVMLAEALRSSPQPNVYLLPQCPNLCLERCPRPK
jgi:hypothetical protein